MKFTKLHGAGNDYVYVSLFDEIVENPEETAKIVSDRHFGIGADGLILIGPSDKADVRMHMYNADGSRGKMCGNGVRCVGKYAYDHGLAKKKVITVETDAGIKILEMQIENDKAIGAKVDMGCPILTPRRIPMAMDGERFVLSPILVEQKEVLGTAVSMGNPHLVIYVDDVNAPDLEKIGPSFENHPLFPERVNTEFIEVVRFDEIKMRVWERGSGETLACGTGACASVVAGVLAGKNAETTLVHLRGGDLTIHYDTKSGHVFMTGPAVEVFTGEISL